MRKRNKKLIWKAVAFYRALEIAELKLETDEDLHEWREERCLGPVTVELNHEQVDLASRELGVGRLSST